MSRTFALARRMEPRDPDEEHRVSTPLELLVDLTFVVAVAQASAEPAPLARGGPRRHRARRLSRGLLRGVVGVDELHLVRVGVRHRRRDLPGGHVGADGRGARARGRRAAGLRPTGDFAVVVVGYLIMRVALVFQWLRASRHGERPATARRYAVGITACEVGWVAMLALQRRGADRRAAGAGRARAARPARRRAGRRPRRGTRSTSPSGTACSRSSCSASRSSPRRSASRSRSTAARRSVISSRSAPAAC